MADFLSHFERTMNEERFTVERSTKRKLSKKIKHDLYFCNLLKNNEVRLIFLPRDLSRGDLVIQVMELKKKLNLY